MKVKKWLKTNYPGCLQGSPEWEAITDETIHPQERVTMIWDADPTSEEPFWLRVLICETPVSLKERLSLACATPTPAYWKGQIAIFSKGLTFDKRVGLAESNPLGVREVFRLMARDCKELTLLERKECAKRVWDRERETTQFLRLLGEISAYGRGMAFRERRQLHRELDLPRTSSPMGCVRQPREFSVSAFWSGQTAFNQELNAKEARYFLMQAGEYKASVAGRVALENLHFTSRERGEVVEISDDPGYWRGRIGTFTKQMTAKNRERLIESSDAPEGWYGPASVHAHGLTPPERLRFARKSNDVDCWTRTLVQAGMMG